MRSTARDYLKLPVVADRPNLHVRDETLVRRVVFEGTTAVGVEAVGSAWAAAVSSGSVFTRQYRMQRRDGGHTWVVARAVPIPTGGPVREWVGSITDVSDRVRLEETREQFLAILGHDLRNPLNLVSMVTQALVLGGLKKSQVVSVDMILRSVRRMEGMILDLLDFARGRLGGGIPLTPTATDLRERCAEALAAARAAHPQRAIEFEATGDLSGEWDTARLDQVFANLIDNAIQHGADTIRVCLRDEGAEVVMTVGSGGAPIPEELLGGIFEPFHGRARSRSEGLGLWLYIVSEIVRAHGGAIAVRSSEGEGTTFTARWPKRRPVEP